MREAALPMMLPGLRETVRGQWWGVPAARRGVILLDRLPQSPAVLERVYEELCLYLQAAGVAVLRVAGGHDDLGARALLASVAILRAHEVERIALVASTDLIRRSPLPQGQGENEKLPARLLWSLVVAALCDTEYPEQIPQRLVGAIAMVRSAMESIHGVAWLLVPSSHPRAAAWVRGSARFRAMAVTQSPDLPGEHAAPLPSLLARLSPDDSTGAVISAIGRLYAWALEVLREERSHGEVRQSGEPRGNAVGEELGGLDQMAEAWGAWSAWNTSRAHWLAWRWHDIMQELRARAPERAGAIWRRLQRATEGRAAGRAHDARIAARIAWPLLDSQARFEWLEAWESTFLGDCKRAYAPPPLRQHA